jgi:hypothetical protein
MYVSDEQPVSGMAAGTFPPTHTPPEQVGVDPEQATQVEPALAVLPHCVLLSAVTHVPPEVQQPEQLLALHDVVPVQMPPLQVGVAPLQATH